MQFQTHHAQNRSQAHDTRTSTRISYASIPVSNEQSIIGTKQPLPQFDECAKQIVVPAITTA